MQLALGREFLEQTLRTHVAIDDNRDSRAERIAFTECLAHTWKLCIERRDDFPDRATRDVERFGTSGSGT